MQDSTGIDDEYEGVKNVLRENTEAPETGSLNPDSHTHWTHSDEEWFKKINCPYKYQCNKFCKLKKNERAKT